jgi:hypothetical protein
MAASSGASGAWRWQPVSELAVNGNKTMIAIRVNFDFPEGKERGGVE